MYVLSTWDSDIVDIFRVVEVTADGLTKHERRQIAERVPCRVYSSQVNNLNVRDTAATVRASEKLSCAVDVDIMAGDELLVTRGAGIGRGNRQAVRYLAGEPQDFFDPVGGALTGLEHKEVGLLRDNIAR